MQMNILVVDDTKLSRESLQSYLADLGHHTESHANPFTALEALDAGRWDLVITDLRMPSMDGLEFFREIQVRSPETSVILMTAFGTVETAVQALKRGAEDYLLKPFQPELLQLHLERLSERLKNRREVESLRRAVGSQRSPFGLVGRSQPMQKVFRLIEQFAGRTSNVLITGETGTGKEMVARALHEGSDRRKGPFVPVPCGAVPRDLAESELFGHEPGAFTSANRRRLGQFELADHGTLFLDDVDDLPLILQPKLLRAIQGGEFQRVGGERLLKSDVRVISSSKKDLKEMTRLGAFREDLFYRLQVLTIELPPLRDRSGDIPLLAHHFMELCGHSEGGVRKTLSRDAEALLSTHDWPGNVRELRHAVEYALAVAKGPQVQVEDLPLRAGPRQENALFTFDPGDREEVDLRSLHAEVEKQATFWAMKKAMGDQGKAAEILGIPRTTFIYRLRQLKAALIASGSGSPEWSAGPR